MEGWEGLGGEGLGVGRVGGGGWLGGGLGWGTRSGGKGGYRKPVDFLSLPLKFPLDSNSSERVHDRWGWASLELGGVKTKLRVTGGLGRRRPQKSWG